MLTDRDRLFVVAALRKGVLSEEQLAQACEQVAADSGQSLISRLARQGAVSMADLQAFDAHLDSLLNRLTGDRHNNLRARANRRVLEVIDEIKNERLRQMLRPPDETTEVLSPRMASASVSYRLLGIRGEGGLGRVWIARDEALHRDVAIKEIRPDRCNDRAHHRRFLREALLTGRLQHPNIVPVYHQGADADGERPFFAMRLLGGRTLQETIAEYQLLPAAERPAQLYALIATLIRVCDAMAYAHSRGIIHRDLKPENIMDAEFGEVLVLDWGLAKQVGEPDDPSLGDRSSDLAGHEMSDGLTRAGSVMGSPGFMAPEQAAGAVSGLDFRTDIYGLGAILFAILTGQPPHRRPGDDSVGSVLKRIVSDPTPRAIAVTPSAPPALDAICAKAMARAPEDRYPSVQEFANDLRRWGRQQPVSAYRERWTKRLARWASNHRIIVQSAMLVLIAIAIIATGVCIHTWKEQRALKERALETFHRDTVAFEVGLSTRIDQFRVNVQFVSTLPSVQHYIEATETGTEGKAFEEVRRTFLGFTQSHSVYYELALVGLGASAPALGFHKDLDSSHPLDAHESERLHQVIRTAFPGGVQHWKPGHVHLSDVRQQELHDGQIAFSPHLWAATAVQIPKSSKVFGLVAARMELPPLFDQLQSTYAPQVTAFVTTSSGDIIYESDERSDSSHSVPTEPRRIQELFPQLHSFFATDNHQRPLTLQEPSRLLYVRNVAFDPETPDRHVCMVIVRSLDSIVAGAGHVSSLVITMSASLVIAVVLVLFGFSRVFGALNDTRLDS